MELNPWPCAVELVRAVVSAAPSREFVGEVRLQRAVYLLDRLGLGSGFTDWDMGREGGPRSERLHEALRLAEALKGVRAETRRRETDGWSYRVFHPLDRAEVRLPETDGRGLLGLFDALGQRKLRRMLEA